LNQNNGSILVESGSVEQTMAVGAAVARAVLTGDMIALIGELGAGKTQFVRGLAEGLGLDPSRVSSPTFVFMQEYNPPPPEVSQGSSGEARSLVITHVDAYRLAGEDDLASIGWEGDGEELRDGAVLVVEWADRITDALPADRLEVNIAHLGEGRAITLNPHGSWRDRIAELKLDHAST